MRSPLQTRARHLDSARAETSDLLVVGGGINGVGIALDAASRGLRTVLVERDDLAVGTSSRSSKLIHGGLRYLEQYRFGLVREALKERRLLTTSIAPHLVRLERFIVPVRGGRWQTPYVGAGLTLYDLLGGRHGGRLRYLSPAAARARVPALRGRGLVAAFEYGDGVVDDARYVAAVARTAARLGARVLTRCEVVGTLRAGVVTVRDLVGGEELTLSARVTVDATGVFEAERGDREGWLHPSRGSHILVPRGLIPSQVGLTLRVPGRVVFLIPWGTHWLIGTTDVPHQGPVSHPTVTAEEVGYLVAAVEEALEVRLAPDDIVAGFAGIRPLVGEGDDTVTISREESIEEREPGLIAVRGGKYTTYRLVAQRAVDRAASVLGSLPASPTATIPLVGAVPGAALPGLVAAVQRLGVEATAAGHLVSRYGAEAVDVARLGVEEDLLAPLDGGLPYLEAEVVWAVRHEFALGLDDVMARRTRIAFEDREHGAAVAGRVAELVGAELGWEESEREQAVKEYLDSAAAEYGVPGEGGPRRT